MSGRFWDKGPMVVTGCTKVSPGCDRCWSEKAHAMRSANPDVQHVYNPDSLTGGQFNGKVQFNLGLLEKAVKGKACVIAAWNDLYHEGVTRQQIYQALDIMHEHTAHTFLIITKRPERAVDVIGGTSGAGLNQQIPPHIWHIATMENQEQADKRMPHLLEIPGKRGIIIEPMLGPVNISDVLPYWECPTCGDFAVEHPGIKCINGCGEFRLKRPVHQVILGPENGSGKRPMEESWAESVREQCEAAGVPFFRKDTGQGELAWKK